MLECVGSGPAMGTPLGIVRPGGAIGRVSVPHYGAVDLSGPFFYHNVIVGAGPLQYAPTSMNYCQTSWKAVLSLGGCSTVPSTWMGSLVDIEL